MSGTVTPLMAKDRLERWCASEDRSYADARKKLFSWKIYGAEQDDIITDLIVDGFLNEERYARAFARGKFKIKRWGRIKIKQQLKLKQISDYCIQAGLSEIDDSEYYDTLRTILTKKKEIIRESDHWKLKQKLLRFASQRGFEPALIYEILPEIIENND